MIELYISETCPYCRKVTDFLYDNNVHYAKKDISNLSNFDKLLELGGKNQVPFMVDNETRMYESDDIIKYVRDKYVL